MEETPDVKQPMRFVTEDSQQKNDPFQKLRKQIDARMTDKKLEVMEELEREYESRIKELQKELLDLRTLMGKNGVHLSSHSVRISREDVIKYMRSRKGHALSIEQITVGMQELKGSKVNQRSVYQHLSKMKQSDQIAIIGKGRATRYSWNR